MAVHIRLKRIGKNQKGRLYFRVAAFDERKGRDGRVLEELGNYDSFTGNAKLNKERCEYWIKNGAQPSDTVRSLLKKQK
jgi:small subunit ribosomal protein S16